MDQNTMSLFDEIQYLENRAKGKQQESIYMEKGAALASILGQNNAVKRKRTIDSQERLQQTSSVEKLPKVERGRSNDQYQQMAEMVAK
jgi:hypothetical protein